MAAAVSADVPHAVRTLCFLPTWQIFTSLGIIYFIDLVQKLKVKTLSVFCYLFFVFCFLFNFGYYLHQYYVHQSQEYSRYWQYGYKQLVAELEKLKPEYKKIRVSIEAEQPYMFFLFYTKYDPKKYLAAGGTKSGGFWEEHYFDKYEFIRFNWDKEEKQDRFLWAVTAKEVPGEAKVIKTIYLLNHQPMFYIFKI